MMLRLGIALVLVALAAPAAAETEHPAQCMVARHLVVPDFPLPHTRTAIAAGRLTVLVVGAGSSRLPVRGGAEISYPARLRQALAQALPGVNVTLATNVKPHRSAAAMVRTLRPALAAAKPALVIWQTGTVDAMQAVDPDDFSDTLEDGIDLAQAAGADVVLVNAQYSPRTESMIALGTYLEVLRWNALQYELPLFDRFGVMKLWADLGTFDLTPATNKLDMARQVHDCIGRLLGDLVVAAAKPGRPQTRGR